MICPSLLVAGICLAQPAAEPVPAEATVARLVAVLPAPVPRRVALSDVVVVGKVVRIEDKTVAAARAPGDTEKTEHRIAVVQVDEVVGGARRMKEVRVGFAPPPPNPRPRPGGFRAVTLEKDQEVCLFLSARPDADFYYAREFADVVDRKAGNFAADLAEAKRCVKLLADPDAGLKSEAAEDRYLTAAMLVTRYRTPRWPTGLVLKTERVDAARSKAILSALAEADWAGPNRRLATMTPQAVFQSLGLGERDGWKQPTDFRQFEAEAKKWIEAHKDSHRIERFVEDRAEGR